MTKNNKVSKGNYGLWDLYGEVSNTYGRLDEGCINKDEAVDILVLSCRQFLVANKK